MKLKSLAIPAMGTGTGHFHAEEAAKIIINNCIDILLDSKNLAEVVIVLFNEGYYNTFKRVLESRFSRR
jgi:O-acetyl-ADP-ribose deacetylase (regulator of RNase III)